MDFNRVLKNIMVENGLNNKSLLAKLHTASDLFYGVDETTLSRWLNNRTVPSFKRQVYIYLMFDVSFMRIIENISYAPRSKNFFKRLNNIFLKEHSYNKISYIPSINNNVRIREDVNEEQWSVILSYYENFPCYRKYGFDRMLAYENTKVICVVKDGFNIPNSHLCYTVLHSDMFVMDKVLVKDKDIFLHLSYYNGFYEFVMVIGLFLIKILQDFDIKSSMRINVYSVVRDSSFNEVYKKLDSKLIFEENVNGVYSALYKTSLFNLISEADVLNLCKFSQMFSSNI